MAVVARSISFIHGSPTRSPLVTVLIRSRHQRNHHHHHHLREEPWQSQTRRASHQKNQPIFSAFAVGNRYSYYHGIMTTMVPPCQTLTTRGGNVVRRRRRQLHTRSGAAGAPNTQRDAIIIIPSESLETPTATMMHHHHRHPVIEALLSANARWAEDVDRADPHFFRASLQGQFPKILWIGCADSRVPETVITSSRPGDIFVHRNIANQFHPSDESALAILDFAVDVLRVEHVLVVGHKGCAGVAACLETARSDADRSSSSSSSSPIAPTRQRPIDRWLTPLTTLARSMLASSSSARAEDRSEEELAERLVEANVRAQLANVCNAQPVIRAWTTQTHPLWVHGLVYDVGNGRLKDLKISQNGL